MTMSNSTSATQYQYKNVDNILSLDNLRCTNESYTVTDTQNSDSEALRHLGEKLENHLALCHYHQSALLALSHHEDENNDHWRFGAHLLDRHLQGRSETLMRSLNVIVNMSESRS